MKNMKNNYYHRGNGECVRQKMHCPYRNDKYYTRCDKDDCNCLFLSEADAYCDPTRPVGWLHGVREVYQVKRHTTSDWKDFGNNEFWHDWTPANRRIWIEPVAERENYEQEAQGLYKISDIASDLWKSRMVAVRSAHIKARQMAEQEIRELREENERLKGILEHYVKAMEPDTDKGDANNK